MSDEPEPYVLGREIAAARANDDAHRAGSTVASPLADVRYEPTDRAGDLVRFRPLPVDERLRDIVLTWIDAGADHDAHAATRDALTMDDFYRLLLFAKRAALRSLTAADAEREAWGRAAIAAVGIVDGTRVDWRDATLSAVIAIHVIGVAGLDVRREVAAAADRAEATTADVLRRFAAEPPPSLEPWGAELVRADDAVRLFDRGYRRFKPTVDLAAIALSLAEAIETDTYAVRTITLANDLPDVWFRGSHQDDAAHAIRTMKGCISINAEPADPDVPYGQMFLVFLCQTKDASTADALARASREATLGHAALGLARGNVSCITIARSFVAEVEGLETTESLRRFEAPFSRILAEHIDD